MIIIQGETAGWDTRCYMSCYVSHLFGMLSNSNVVVWFGVEKKATGLLHGGVAGSVSLL